MDDDASASSAQSEKRWWKFILWPFNWCLWESGVCYGGGTLVSCSYFKCTVLFHFHVVGKRRSELTKKSCRNKRLSIFTESRMLCSSDSKVDQKPAIRGVPEVAAVANERVDDYLRSWIEVWWLFSWCLSVKQRCCAVCSMSSCFEDFDRRSNPHLCVTARQTGSAEWAVIVWY